MSGVPTVAPPALAVVGVSAAAAGVAVVTLDRPAARNAVSRQLVSELSAALETLEADESIRVVILTGAGDRAFCAGADLKEASSGNIFDLFTRTGGFAGMTHAPRRKPWIAAVNGPAVAGGCEIALACDLIVASEDAIFSLPEPQRGLIAGAGGIYRLAHALPPKIATELLLTGTPISAQRAADLGMINRVVPAGEVLEAAITLAREILACAPAAITATLDLLHLGRRMHEAGLQRASEEKLALVTASAAFREGATAFLERRPPAWSVTDG